MTYCVRGKIQDSSVPRLWRPCPTGAIADPAGNCRNIHPPLPHRLPIGAYLCFIVHRSVDAFGDPRIEWVISDSAKLRCDIWCAPHPHEVIIVGDAATNN